MRESKEAPTLQQRSTVDSLGIQIACDRNPEFGVPFNVAPGIWWVRLPVASALQAVNVYLLADGRGITLVDTGVRSAECRSMIQSALCHANLASFKLTRIIVTHFHPDHMGLAGELARDGVELWTSRQTWLNCQLLSANKQLLPVPQEVTFMQQAGLTGIELEAFRRRAGGRYSALVAPPPDHYVPIVDGQELSIGQRTWRIVLSYGHAAEHVSLWSQDCVITGDQILPSISSNLTVPFTERDIDLIGEWLRSCRLLRQFSNNESLCLPGHQRPFYGIQSRLYQIEQNIRKTLDRLERLVIQPTAAIDCVEHVYGRTLANDERRSLLPEVVGMLNHLYFHGYMERKLDSEGVYRYFAIDANSSKRARGYRNSDIDADLSNVINDAAGSIPQDHAVQYMFEPNDSGDAVDDSELDEPREARHSRLPRLIAITAIGVLGCVGYLNWSDLEGKVKHVISAVQAATSGSEKHLVDLSAAATPVDTLEVSLETRAEIPRQFTGIVKPRRASQVGFNRIGVIDEILVDRGQRVEADSILARLNTNLLKANLKAIQAQYRAAEARLSELVAGPRSQTIDAARAKVAAAKAELELARSSFDRARRLVDAGAVSKQDFENAKTSVAAKAEALNAEQNVLDELLEGTRSEQVLAQRAQLSELDAAQEQLHVQLEESVLRSPFAARVSERFVEPGAVAAPGTPAFRLVDVESPEVWVGVPAEFIQTLRNEKTTKLTIGNKSCQATVQSILPELDEVTRTNTVIFELGSGQLDDSVLGQIARIDLSRKIELEGFWVPTAALTQGDQGLWALLALDPTGDGQEFVLKRHEVEVMQVDSERVFVRGTVEPGTQLVASGVRRLTPGQRVTRKASLSNLVALPDSGAMDRWSIDATDEGTHH